MKWGVKLLWRISNRADYQTRLIADRHYNRQKPGTKQFVPPGSCFVLYTKTPTGSAFWVTSAPLAEFTKHTWAGAWVCSAFRNEGAGIASSLIREAIAATISYYKDVPELGMITFVDRKKVKPTIVRGKKVWGWCFRKAGFVECGETKSGLLALQMLPSNMPNPCCAKPSLVESGLFFMAERNGWWANLELVS